MATFTANDTITKAVSAELNIGEILLVRGVVAMVLVAALAWYRDALRSFGALLIWPVGLRVIGEIGGTLTYLSAISQIPLANASAIFQALPLVITLGAALVFGEPVGWRRWLAIAAGFIGVLVIVRPGAEGFNQAALLALASVGFCTVRDLATDTWFLGDLLFVAANLARHAKVDVGAALRRANHKFERRFRAMEAMADADGQVLAGQSLDAQDGYWNRAKQAERTP